MNKKNKLIEMKHKEKLNRKISSFLLTLIVIITTIGIILPLHFVFPDVLTIYWVIAICVAVISPFAFVNIKIYMEVKDNYNSIQKKIAFSKLGMSIISIWYADFTFICMFMNWLVAFFILAGLYLVKMVYNVAFALVNRKNNESYPDFLIVGDFVLSFLLIIFLIYKIPNKSLQTIVMTLASGLIGGLLTLIGVMFTIKKSDRDNSLRNKLRNRPILLMIENRSISGTTCDLQKECCIGETGTVNTNLGFIIKNIAPMPCRIYGAEYLGRLVECGDKNLWVETQEKVWIHIRFKNFENNGKLLLLLEDISGYRYEYLLTYDSDGVITSIKDITNMEAN